METDVGSSPRKSVECRICHDEDDISIMDIPCSCSGSLKYAHQRCVQKWCNEKGDTICEICRQHFRPGYVVPPLPSRFGGISLNFRGGWEISRSGVPNTGFLGMVSVDHLFMDPDTEEFSAESSRSLIYCRLVAIIFVVLLLLRQMLPIIFSVADEYSATISMLWQIKIIGVIIFILIMVKVFTAVWHLQHPQYTHNTPEAAWYEENELPWQQPQPQPQPQPHLIHIG